LPAGRAAIAPLLPEDAVAARHAWVRHKFTQPITAKIGKSTVRVELAPFARLPLIAGLNPPSAPNYLYHNGGGRLFVADSGQIWQ
jgi:hypothetical protein